jgi:hypothetical protein
LSRRGITGVSKNGKIALATIILKYGRSLLRRAMDRSANVSCLVLPSYSVLAVSKNLEIASNVVTQLFDMVIEVSSTGLNHCFACADVIP